MAQELERYAKPTRALHWIHLVSFCVLFITGLIIFIPGLSLLAQDSITRVIHRIAAAVFVIAPLIYLLSHWKATWKGVGKAFIWGSDDIGWLQAAPRYYFLGDETAMPPQDEMNSGQKLWWLITVVFGVIFAITGAIMWFAKGIAPTALLQWMTLLHDISFIASGLMLFVHIYLGVIHPMMKGAWGAITTGKISADYAKSHHEKWYNRVTRGKEVQTK